MGRWGKRASILLQLLALSLGPSEGCKKEGRDLDRLLAALRSCDLEKTCEEALSKVKALPPEVKETSEGQKIRTLALKLKLIEASAFPDNPSPSLQKTSFSEIKAEASALGLEDAFKVAELLEAPTCERFLALSYVSRPEFRPLALLARIKVLATLLAPVEAFKAAEFGMAAKGLLGCTLSQRATLATSLVEARSLLSRLVEECRSFEDLPKPLAKSCDNARSLVFERPLPLPWPDVGAGDLFYAMLPRSMRGLGIRGTPPWAFVVAAGRLGVFDQAVLGEGVTASPEQTVDWRLDLRQRHTQDELKYVFSEAFSTRKPYPLGDGSVVFMVVDASTTASELFEVLDAFLATSDALLAIGAHVFGQPEPIFIPLNYRIEERILLDPLGIPTSFGKEAPIEVTLEPFSITLQGNEVFSSTPKDLESALLKLYTRVEDLVGPKARPLRLRVGKTVPFERVISVLETLSFKVPKEDAKEGRFRSAGPQRGRDGAPARLCKVAVVAPIE